MPPCRRPSGCLRFSRTSKRTRAAPSVGSSHSRPRYPSNVLDRSMSGTGSPARSQGESRSDPPSGTEDNGLGLRVVVEGLDPVLLAVAAGLPAAEGQLVVHLGARVDPRVPRLDALGGVPRAAQVAGPDRGAQPERGGVRAGDGLVQIGDAPD